MYGIDGNITVKLREINFTDAERCFEEVLDKGFLAFNKIIMLLRRDP